jgi:hypothetical protein
MEQFKKTSFKSPPPPQLGFVAFGLSDRVSRRLGALCARIGPLSQFPSDSDPSDSASAWLRVEN